MAAIPLPVCVETDAISRGVELDLERWLALCQTGATTPAGGTVLKVNLTLLNSVLTDWTTALATQIATLA